MQFLYPLFLIAGLTLAIPIILHLFYFRRFKKVYFTNVRFLKEVKEETSARSRLRNLLVLLMRLLAFLFLVLAFAQPFVSGKDEERKGIRAVSVFVDNSFSMSALSQDVPLLEQAKARAREVIRSFNVEDQFQVLTHDLSGGQQRLLSQEDALAAVDAITLSSDSRKFSNVLERQRQALATARTSNHITYWISDFQKTGMDVEGYRDSTLELNLLPLQPVRLRNISIDSAWFEAPLQVLNQTNPLFVRVRNHSDELAENIRLSLDYEGQTKPVGVLEIPPRSSVVDTVNLTVLRTGWRTAKLSLTDYPIQFDDHYYFSFSVAEKIKVLAISDGGTVNRFLDAALRGLPQFELAVQNSQALEYSRFPEYQMIVLDEVNTFSTGLTAELKRYADQGGNVLVFPDRNVKLEEFRNFMGAFSANQPMAFDTSARQVSEVNTEEFVFRDVFDNKSSNLRLPATKGSFRFMRGSSAAEELLLTFRDGGAFVSKYASDKGNLYVCAAPLDQAYSNLSNSGEIFVPMLYKMAISGGGSERIAFTIGRDELLEGRHSGGGVEMVYKMKGASEEFIPEQRIVGNALFLGVYDQIRDAGNYDLFLQKDTVLQTFAFNYDRRESELEYFDNDALQTFAGPLANVIVAKDEAVLAAKIEERGRGTSLWRWAILLTLIFLAAETLLLRFWRV